MFSSDMPVHTLLFLTLNLRENKKSAVSMGIELRNHGTADERDNHYTIWGLKICRQKDIIFISIFLG